MRRGQDAHVHRPWAAPPTGSTSRSWSTRSSFACSETACPRSRRGTRCRRAAARTAPPALDRAGERALLVAEQLALEQGLGQRRAVHRHERSRRRAGRGGGCRRPATPCPCRFRPGSERSRPTAPPAARARSRSSICGLARDDPRTPCLRPRRPRDDDESFSACSTCASSSRASNGFGRNPKTPRRVASTASGIVPCAVRMITGRVGACFRTSVEKRKAVHSAHLEVGHHDVRTRHRDHGERASPLSAVCAR